MLSSALFKKSINSAAMKIKAYYWRRHENKSYMDKNGGITGFQLEDFTHRSSHEHDRKRLFLNCSVISWNSEKHND